MLRSEEDMLEESENFGDQIKKRYHQFVKITNESVIWNEYNKKDDIKNIIKIVNSNYERIIENCKKRIKKYIECNVDKLMNGSGELVYEFSEQLSLVHPYFVTEISTERTDGKHSPFHDILTEQLIADLSEKFQKEYRKDKEITLDLILKYLKPVLNKIDDKNADIERIKKEVERREEIYKEHVEYDIIVNAKKKIITDPLTRIKKSLDSIKYYIYIIALSENKMTETYVIQQFKLNIPRELKEIYKNFPTPARINSAELINTLKLENVISDLEKGDVERASSDLKLINQQYDEYEIECFEHLAGIFLIFILRSDKKISICQNCKKIFLPDRPNIKYCKSKLPCGSNEHKPKTCMNVGAVNVYESNKLNHAVRKIKNRFRMRINREKNPSNIENLKSCLDKWEKEADKIVENYSDESAVNRLEHAYDRLIGEYDCVVRKKTFVACVYPIVYIAPVYDLTIKKSIIAYVICGINEKGQNRVLSVETRKEKVEKDRLECWRNIFIKLKESVEDIYVLLVENPNDVKNAVHEIFPRADIQLNVLSLVKTMESKISDKNKREFTNDLLFIYELSEKSKADEYTRKLSKLWKIKFIQSWLDKWDDILPAFEYSPIFRNSICENSIIKKVYDNLSNYNEYSYINDLKNRLQKSVDDVIADGYLTSLNNWNEMLKELKLKRKHIKK